MTYNKFDKVQVIAVLDEETSPTFLYRTGIVIEKTAGGTLYKVAFDTENGVEYQEFWADELKLIEDIL